MLKKKTQQIIKAFGVWMLSLILCLGAAVPAYAAVTENTKGSIRITGAEPNVIVQPYQLMTVNIEEGTPKDPAYSWVEPQMKDWVHANYPQYDDTNEFNNTVSASDLKAFYSKLAADIKNPAKEVSALPAVQSATVDENGVCELTNLPMGNYLLLMSRGFKVYQPTVVNLIPAWDEDEEDWGLAPVEIDGEDLKGEEPSIEKTVNDGKDKDDAAIGDVIPYEIKATIPTYPEGATNKIYNISDTLSEGLTFNPGSLKAFLNDVELTAGDDYVIASGSELGNKTFKLVFNYDKLKARKGGEWEDSDRIRVTYTATLNDKAKVTTGNENEAHLEYSNNPYGDGTNDKEPGTKPKVYTYGIIVNKKTDSETPEFLPGAEFELKKGNDKFYFIKESDGKYRVAKSGDTGATTTLKVGEDGDPKGKLEIRGLDLGTYTLTETKAPGGYNKLREPYTLILRDEVDDSGDNPEAGMDGTLETTQTDKGTANGGNYEVTVLNKKGFELPVTGGRGTIMFTVGGILLIALAGAVLVISRRRNSESEA